jgi:hypothetical protein
VGRVEATLQVAPYRGRALPAGQAKQEQGGNERM